MVGGILLLTSCHSNQYPKPREYYRIDFPKELSLKNVTTACPFMFTADTATIVLGTEQNGDACQFQLYYPKYKAEIFFTYFDISPKRPLVVLLDEMHKLTYEHQVKAESIKARTKGFPEENKYTLTYHVEGNVASSNQFLVTDSLHHYVRGALYFRVSPNQDSLRPVVAYFNTEIDRLIESFKWKD